MPLRLDFLALMLKQTLLLLVLFLRNLGDMLRVMREMPSCSLGFGLTNNGLYWLRIALRLQLLVTGILSL